MAEVVTGPGTTGAAAAPTSAGSVWLSGASALLDKAMSAWVAVEQVRGAQALSGQQMQTRYTAPELESGYGVQVDNNAYQQQQQAAARAAGGALQIAGFSVPTVLVGVGVLYWLMTK